MIFLGNRLDMGMSRYVASDISGGIPKSSPCMACVFRSFLLPVAGPLAAFPVAPLPLSSGFVRSLGDCCIPHSM